MFLAAIFLGPVFLGIYYDGIARLPDWPPLFFWFSALGFPLLGYALWLLSGRSRAVASAAFHDGGFTLDFAMFLRPRQHLTLHWRDIEAVTAASGNKGNDFVEFLLAPAAAEREKLVVDRSKATENRRKLAFPVKFSAVRLTEAMERFRTSAEGAGARLEETKSVNYLILARQTWAVVWP